MDFHRACGQLTYSGLPLSIETLWHCKRCITDLRLKTKLGKRCCMLGILRILRFGHDPANHCKGGIIHHRAQFWVGANGYKQASHKPETDDPSRNACFASTRSAVNEAFFAVCIC